MHSIDLLPPYRRHEIYGKNMGLYEIRGRSIWMTDTHAQLTHALSRAGCGQFAVAKGYISETDRELPEVADINFKIRTYTTNEYQRIIEHLEQLSVKDLDFSEIPEDPIKVVKIAERIRKQEIQNYKQTINRPRKLNPRFNPDNTYHMVTNGVKLNLISDEQIIKSPQKNLIFRKRIPVLVNGYPVAHSTLLKMIENGRRIIIEGKYKPIAHRLETCIKQVIQSSYSPSWRIKFLTLRSGKFESINFGGIKVSM